MKVMIEQVAGVLGWTIVGLILLMPAVALAKSMALIASAVGLFSDGLTCLEMPQVCAGFFLTAILCAAGSREPSRTRAKVK